ncbi:NlpC/P60 family protein [Aquipuribacter hungaricus]|uniref:C40 family peptidase n=1 Tax=Aquipuribacter hungaricus TaxID=545624 RepID=UPI003616F081
MTLVAPAAQASDVEDARAEVQELGREVEVAAEAYNEARVQTEAQKQHVAAAQARVASQATAVEAMQDELGALAVETYKRGGVDPQLVALVGSVGSYATSTSTLTVMAERRSVSLSDLKEATDDLEALQAAAAVELEQVAAMEADLAGQKTAIEARLAGAEDVLAAAEAEAARIEAARVAAAEEATRSRQAAEAAQALAAGPAVAGTAVAAGSTAAAGTRAAAPAGAPAGAPAAGQAPAASAGTMSCGGVSVDVPTDRVATVLAFACSQLGKPYVWGASGPNAYDCSGFTMASWAKAGVSLPHSSRSQAGVGTRVSEGDLRAGDLVFSFSPISHVGIYLGGGKMIAAPSAGDVVKIQSLQYLPYTAGTRL